MGDQVRVWLHGGVDLFEFFQPYQGKYRGRDFNSETPPHMYFPNAPICKQFVPSINDTITKRLIEGSVELLGAVHEVSPPKCVNALSIEPSKPRLVLSMKGPNLWCKDTPFKLVPLGDIVKPVHKGGFFSGTDDAQGYKQLLLTGRSKTFCGFEWAGFYFEDTTLPFGFKNSAYIYSTVGFCLSTWLKNRGIHTEVWIDDRFIGEAGGDGKVDGYKKKETFAGVREDILSEDRVCLKTMQRFIGKCQSFVLVFPAARLFVRECCSFTSQMDDVTPVQLTQSVREEVLFWRFIDSVSQPIPWRQERHLRLLLSSDASGYRWGGVLAQGNKGITFGDYWPPEVQRSTDICYKEALALYFVLISVMNQLWDKRVDVQVDSEGLYHAWSGLRARSTALAGVLRLILAFTLEANFDLRLQWVPSGSNRADVPSRTLSRADSKLSSSLWWLLQEEFGGNTGFTLDLMALQSNVPQGKNGLPIKFFSRDLVPGTSGVNVFAQPCPRGEVLYAFPPFVLISSVIRLLREWGDVVATLVVPKHPHPRPWWPHLNSFAQKSMRLSEAGQTGVLEVPSRSGYVPNGKGLPFELWAFRCYFPPGPDILRESRTLTEQKSVLIVSDSMFKGIVKFAWPSFLKVNVNVNGGAKMATLLRILAAACRSQKLDLAVLHGGINDISNKGKGAAGVGELLRVFKVASRRLRVQCPDVQFVLSAVCQTRSVDINHRVASVNSALRELCERPGWHFLSNDHIYQRDLKDQVHLTVWGSLKLHRRLQMFLRSICGGRTGVAIHPEADRPSS
ncbi:uncharacterized protein LOC119719725 [Patiria miniata]|uniref:Uncharacterized protein n=1 Tax=Patiria miniata TaxID=46514 RepID=A0A913Z2C5_PATMI|nr:uncharacterized protein LOC119719725 [Patiria miniata]